MLFFEVDGILRLSRKKAEIAEITSSRCEGSPHRTNMDEANKYWLARRAVSRCIGKARQVFAEDVTVPRGNIPKFVKKIGNWPRNMMSRSCLGHAGDGNSHRPF
jgi:FAD/FMN-containing dehydrogenase